ncbi:MAG: uroporphyrinogen decarboxylase family protein [Nitrososphaerota archaeon]|nr:uroporphyrinogen decarboxylase family protein [Nitrososphaerota archaeon]
MAPLSFRERFDRYMRFKDVDRPPFYEFLGFWVETLNRWRGEGLPAGVDVYDYFGFDKREMFPMDYGPIPRFISRTIEEDDRYRVEVNDMGIVMRVLKTSTSMPTFIDFPVKSRSDWVKIRERFNPRDMRRYPKAWSLELIEYYRSTDRVVGLSMPGFFGQARYFMGLERLLVSFYRDPGLVHDIMNFWVDFLIEASRDIVENVKLDYVSIWEDMCYNRGPHISPKLFEEFMLPCYKKLTGFLRGKGIDIIMVDTDGNHEVLNDLLVEGGVNCLYPLEAAAGMDAVKLRERYGEKLLMIGNIDKRVIAVGGSALRREVERKITLTEEGGYIVSTDHAVSADISFHNYVEYIGIVKKWLKI